MHPAHSERPDAAWRSAAHAALLSVLAGCSAGPAFDASGTAGGSPTAPDVEAVARYTPAPPAPVVEAPPPPATEAESRARAAGAGNGTFQITLTWDNKNDLDLHLLTPCGERVYFGTRTACAATLDVDMNVRPETDTPVEHINGELRDLRSGRYEIRVVRYADHIGTTADDYAVELRLGDKVENLRGRISGSTGFLRSLTGDAPEVSVTTFDIP